MACVTGAQRMATFRQRDGRWQAIIRRVDLKATKTFDRLTDAKVWARGKERAADLGDAGMEKMAGTIKPVIEKYEAEVWPEKRWGRSKANELDVLKRDVGPWTFDTFTKSRIVGYVRKLDLEPSGRGTRLSYLREVLRSAKDLWDYPMDRPLKEIDAAIAAARRQKIIGKSNERDRRPTEDEIARIIAYGDAMERNVVDLSAVVRVLAIVPFRMSELLRIQWPDLIPERRSVIIRGRKHPDFRVKERNDQEVPLIAFGGFDTYALIADRPSYFDSPFPYKGNSVSMAFIMACLRLQIEDLHLHDLRGHAISTLFEADIPIPQVALMSGHRDWKVLARVYARIRPESVHRTIARAQGIPSRTPPGTGDDDSS